MIKYRKASTRLLEEIAEGILDRDTVINAFISYLDEDQVADMCFINEFFDSGEDDDDGEPLEDDDDDDPDDGDDDPDDGDEPELPNFGMFSTEGNRRVEWILSNTLSFDGLSQQAIWAFAYSQLEILSREADFGEATDTVVRQALWDQLVQHRAITLPSAVDYWFYVEWDAAITDLFQECVDRVQGNAV